MTSMTGYGFAESVEDERSVSVEIRSYNNRYLEVVPGLPAHLAALEPEIRSHVSSAIRRGKVDVQVRVREFSSAIDIRLDEHSVATAIELLGRIAQRDGVSGRVTVGDLLQIDGVLTSERRRSVDEVRAHVLRLLDGALNSLNTAREREGAVTRSDIEANFNRIRSFEALFESKGVETERRIIENIREKFSAVVGDEMEESRIYNEAAAFVVKHSTNEELKRLRSHLNLFAMTLESVGPIGKKLDFICQEINREINTMASKALLPEVQHAVIEAKDALESIREQVRNVE